jgi:hypothetical protein
MTTFMDDPATADRCANPIAGYGGISTSVMANSNRRFPVQSGAVGAQFGRALESSTDRLAAFGHLFHEHLLADLSD